MQCFLPCGKAEHTAYPLLPRVCSSILQLHPRTPWICSILDFCNVGDNNPPDGSNWELLCIYCHDNEHSRDQVADWYDETTPAGGQGQEPHHDNRLFANLKDLLKEKNYDVMLSSASQRRYTVSMSCSTT